MITRDDLYQLVWSKPMTKVAEQFGVSGSYLARVCTMLSVPRPEQGYWAKLAVGKAPPPKPLPKAQPGDQLYWVKDGEHRPPPLRPRRLSESPTQTRLRTPRTRTHRLIHGVRENFENSRPIDDGGYLKPYKKLLADITASQACLEKALSFTSDLFNALEATGHRVILGPRDERLRRATIDERELGKKQRRYYYGNLWSPYRPTVVYIGDLAIGLAIIEMSEEVLLRYVGGKYIRESDYVPPKLSRHHVDHTWTTTRDLPSGRLRLVAYSPYWRVDWSTTWQETKNESLQSSLKSIASSIQVAATELVAKLEEADRKAEIARLEQLAAEEKRQRQEDRRRVEQSIQESKEHLGQIIQQWSNVMNVERFLAGVQQRAGGLPEADRGAILERLKLAREFLGTQDPLNFFLSWKTPEERYQPRYAEE